MGNKKSASHLKAFPGAVEENGRLDVFASFSSSEIFQRVKKETVEHEQYKIITNLH